MPHHDWSDDGFDWKGLGSAINYCQRFWKKWGRIGSYGKEKYGTFRDNIVMWDGGLLSLIKPGYFYIDGPIMQFIYYKLDYYVIRPLMVKTGLHRLGIEYQSFIYNYAIQKMCKKYPHLVDELVSDLDGYKMVKPGIFGNIDGEKIHKKYWKIIDMKK